MPRLFFGLEIPPDTRDALLRVQQTQAALAGARWHRDSQLHLTLAFLGEVPEGAVATAVEAGRQVRAEPFSVQVQGLGCFGDPERPGILWAGVAPEAPLTALHHRLTEALAQQGLVLEDRPYRPHITLSRFRRSAGPVTGLLSQYAGTEFGALPVSGMALFLSSPGSVYSVLERFSFAGEDA